MELEHIDFSKCPACYWSDATKLTYLQRRIIVYSIMYYERNASCVSDAYFDGISRQLVELMEAASFEELRKSMYYYCMHDFDGSTGFHLYSRLTKSDREYLDLLVDNILEGHTAYMNKLRNKERVIVCEIRSE